MIGSPCDPSPASGAGLANRLSSVLLPTLLVLAIAAVHVATYRESEPFYNNDETRHVMTGVFFHDLYRDLPLGELRPYAIRYYVQYPALGLLIWPPFFYAVEGLFMLAAGTSFLAAKVLIGLFAAAACTYLFLLARRTHGTATAALAVLLFGFAPLVFMYSRQVMLEVPTLACALAAVYHCQRFLDLGRRRDLVLCCLATALTALTRFDGVFLAPLFLIWLVGRRRLDLLRRWDVLTGALGAVLLVAPAYALTALEIGGAHLRAIREGTSPDSTTFLHWTNLYFYPACVPEQIGWAAVPFVLIGLVAALRECFVPRSPCRQDPWPYLAMLGAVYLTFTPLAEVEARHAIYWVPALAVFAADGVRRVAAWTNRTWAVPVLGTTVVAATCVTSVLVPVATVTGYEDAARYVAAHTRETPLCLFDSYLNGNFIYQLRRHDPERRLWVLRGDKLFFSFLSDPRAGYQERVRGEQDVLDLIHRYDPELLVVEDPPVAPVLPLAQMVGRTLRAHPERFRLETVIPVVSNYPPFKGVELRVYRNTYRNPDRSRNLEVEMLGLGRALQAPTP